MSKEIPSESVGGAENQQESTDLYREVFNSLVYTSQLIARYKSRWSQVVATPEEGQLAKIREASELLNEMLDNLRKTLEKKHNRQF